jgi:hypothetical protein
MVSQVLDKLDSWLGRSFVLARYFPWLLFAAANLLIASLEFPEVRVFVSSEYNHLGSSDKVVDIVLVLSAVAVVAYTMSPIMQLVTRLLEGQHLWRWVAEPLLLRRALEMQSIAERREKLFQDRAGIEKTEEIREWLADKRAAGERYGTITDWPAVIAAKDAIEELRVRRYLNQPIMAGELAVAMQALGDALQKNCADLTSLRVPVSKAIYDQAVQLDKLHGEASKSLAPYAIDIAQNRERRALDVHDKLFASAELAPTRLGNDVAALRSYCDTRYGLDFDFFWPRLQLVIKDEKLTAKLTTAKIQVEFSLLSLTLSALFVASWLITLGVVGHSLYSLGVVAAVGPPLIIMWLWLVHESYSAYSELVRGTIDVSRFDLLQALRRPLPATTEAEKKVWEQTARLLVLDEHDVEIAFQHPTP